MVDTKESKIIVTDRLRREGRWDESHRHGGPGRCEQFVS